MDDRHERVAVELTREEWDALLWRCEWGHDDERAYAEPLFYDAAEKLAAAVPPSAERFAAAEPARWELTDDLIVRFCEWVRLEVLPWWGEERPAPSLRCPPAPPNLTVEEFHFQASFSEPTVCLFPPLVRFAGRQCYFRFEDEEIERVRTALGAVVPLVTWWPKEDWRRSFEGMGFEFSTAAVREGLALPR